MASTVDDNRGNETNVQDIILHNPKQDLVSAIHRCNTELASRLCIFDIKEKLTIEGCYDIGGTYLNDNSDFWFYFTTNQCPRQTYMLNLFVRCKSPRNFSIGISDSVNIPLSEKTNIQFTLSEKLKWYSFKAVDVTENHFIKTFCFTKKGDFQSILLIIPISIQTDLGLVLNGDIVKSIKLQHDLGALLANQKPDFIITSADGNQHPVHKILLAAHSPVLKSLMKEDTNTLFLDIHDTDVELLIEFINTGSIKKISKLDSRKVLDLAKKFKVDTLFLLAQYLIGDEIDVENAVEVAMVAKKFNLDELLCKVTDFIKQNPEVTKTKAWLELNDIELMKHFFQHINYGNPK